MCFLIYLFAPSYLVFSICLFLQLFLIFFCNFKLFLLYSFESSTLYFYSFLITVSSQYLYPPRKYTKTWGEPLGPRTTCATECLFLPGHLVPAGFVHSLMVSLCLHSLLTRLYISLRSTVCFLHSEMHLIIFLSGAFVTGKSHPCLSEKCLEPPVFPTAVEKVCCHAICSLKLILLLA